MCLCPDEDSGSSCGSCCDGSSAENGSNCECCGNAECCCGDSPGQDSSVSVTCCSIFCPVGDSSYYSAAAEPAQQSMDDNRSSCSPCCR